jgi:cell division protein FtsI/penicillin-binding protein 2
MSRGFASNYRVVLLASLVGLSFVGLGARLVQLHVIDRERLLGYVEKARRDIIVENARRGDILDARNNILATSKSQIVLGVDPQATRPADEPKWAQLAALVGRPLAEVHRIITTKTRPAGHIPAAPATASAANPLKFDFTPSDDTGKEKTDDGVVVEDAVDENGERPIRWAPLCDNVEESVYDKIAALGIAGVYGNRVYRRVYPQNSLAAHLIGYVNKEGTPAAGLEHYADFYLRGQDGWRESERDGKRHELAQFRTRSVDPVDGYQVKLSIDAAVQHIVEEELAAIVQKFQPNKATIIVSDARDGFLLALGNYPTFNLNEYGKADMAALRNIAVADVLEPGSTFKIVAISGAIERGLVGPQSTFDCSIDHIEFKGKVRGLPKEDHHFDHRLTVREITSRSSNRGAAQLAMLMGEQAFYDHARAFGFGQLTGFPIGGEVRGIMAAPNTKEWDGLTITRMPMGQSVAATPLQIHYAMATIASGGVWLRPQVIREIQDARGEVVFRYTRVAERAVIRPETARTMASYLSWVTVKNEGTAPEAGIPGYDVAGKTGTSQKLVDGHYSTTHHVASFVGFFPASRPAVVISVIVDGGDERAPGGVAYGAKVAAPSFKHIGEQLAQLPYLKIEPAAAVPHTAMLAMEGGQR